MRRLLFVIPMLAVLGVNAYAEDEMYTTEPVEHQIHRFSLDDDTSDPLYILKKGAFLSETDVSYVDKVLRFGEQISYGINDRLSLGLNAHYQFGFDDNRGTGFSAFDLGGVYRMGLANNNSAGMSYDVLFGLKFGGSEQVRTPEYAKSTYYAGLKFGKQWNMLTLAGTIKSSWIFDEDRGMAYINFIPEAYFRVSENWRLGMGFDIIKSTNHNLFKDQEWIDFKVVRQYGNTQYVGVFGYEFEGHNAQVTAKVNILF